MKVMIDRLINRQDSGLKAYASLTLDNGYAIHGLKVCSGQKGLFVSMPSTSYIDKNGNKKYQDIFHPVTKEARTELNNEVLKEYKAAINQTQQMGPQMAPPMQNGPSLEEYEEIPIEEPEPVMAM